jgi:hypothetical protein
MWQLIHWLIELPAECEVRDGLRQLIHWLIELLGHSHLNVLQPKLFQPLSACALNSQDGIAVPEHMPHSPTGTDPKTSFPVHSRKVAP